MGVQSMKLRHPAGGKGLASQLKSGLLSFLFLPIISQFYGLLFPLSTLDKYRNPFIFPCQKAGTFFSGSVMLWACSPSCLDETLLIAEAPGFLRLKGFLAPVVIHTLLYKQGNWYREWRQKPEQQLTVPQSCSGASPTPTEGVAGLPATWPHCGSRPCQNDTWTSDGARRNQLRFAEDKADNWKLESTCCTPGDHFNHWNVHDGCMLMSSPALSSACFCPGYCLSSSKDIAKAHSVSANHSNTTSWVFPFYK